MNGIHGTIVRSVVEKDHKNGYGIVAIINYSMAVKTARDKTQRNDRVTWTHVQVCDIFIRKQC